MDIMKARKSVTVPNFIEIIQYVKNLHYLLLFVVATVLVVSGCTGTSSTQSPGAVFIVKLGCMSDLGFGKCNFFRVEHINTAV